MRGFGLAALFIGACVSAQASETGPIRGGRADIAVAETATRLRQQAPMLDGLADLRTTGFRIEQNAFREDLVDLAEEYTGLLHEARGSLPTLECRDDDCSWSRTEEGYYKAEDLSIVFAKLERHVPSLIRAGALKGASRATKSALAEVRTHKTAASAGGKAVPKRAIDVLIVRKIESLEVIEPRQGPGGCGGDD